jgi:hypothetical protein
MNTKKILRETAEFRSKKRYTLFQAIWEARIIMLFKTCFLYPFVQSVNHSEICSFIRFQIHLFVILMCLKCFFINEDFPYYVGNILQNQSQLLAVLNLKSESLDSANQMKHCWMQFVKGCKVQCFELL